MVEYLPFSAFNLTNKGLYKSYAEDSEPIESKELAYLVNKQRLVAQSYTDKMIEHINQNAEEYPEYFTHSESGNPDKTSSYFTGWQL